MVKTPATTTQVKVLPAKEVEVPSVIKVKASTSTTTEVKVLLPSGSRSHCRPIQDQDACRC